MTNEPTVRAYLDAPPERVYRALTEPDELGHWFAEHVDVAVEQGRYAFWGRYTPEQEPGGQRLLAAEVGRQRLLAAEVGRQRLLAAEVGRRLRFAWQVGGAEAAVDIALDPDSTGTLLVLRHDGASEELANFWYLAIANLANHVEGRSLGPRHDYSVTASDTAVVEAVIDASPGAVFAALVGPEQLTRWMMARDPTVEPRVGGRYDIGWDHGPIKILELVPDRVLAYSWAYPNSPETVVRWELEGSGGRTHLTVVHSGFADPALAEQFRTGWPGFLALLKRLVELGPGHRPIEGTF